MVPKCKSDHLNSSQMDTCPSQPMHIKHQCYDVLQCMYTRHSCSVTASSSEPCSSNDSMAASSLYSDSARQLCPELPSSTWGVSNRLSRNCTCCWLVCTSAAALNRAAGHCPHHATGEAVMPLLGSVTSWACKSQDAALRTEQQSCCQLHRWCRTRPASMSRIMKGLKALNRRNLLRCFGTE
jgi:hypothetical protein